MASESNRYRFTVYDYHQMAEAGILTEDDRVELIDGEIVEMSPIGVSHANCVARLTRLLVMHFGTNAVVHPQNPVRLGVRDEPQPDLTVIRAGAAPDALPGPGDVVLLVEVSDTSLRYDRGTKLRLYAAAGIRECWLVDLGGQKIERHTNPAGGAYRTVVGIRRGDTLVSTTAPDLAFDADEVLG